jgi:hypothetical protein
MVAFGRVRKQVENRVVVREEVLWVAGLGSDDIWALDGVAAEENGLGVLAVEVLEQ